MTGHEIVLTDLRPVRPLPPPWMLSLGLLSIVAVIAVLGAWWLSPIGFGMLGAAQRVWIFGALIAAVALAARGLVRAMYPGIRVLFPGWWIGLAVFVLVPAGLAAALRWGDEPRFLRAAWTCLETGLFFAAIAGVLFWLVLRRGAWLDPLASAAVCGALAGLTGLAVLELHCPNLHLNHVLAGHFGAVIVAALAGVGLTASVTSSRPEAN